MRLFFLSALSVVLVAVFAWVLFPTSLGSRHETFKPLHASDFSRIRDDAITFGRSVSPNGIEVISGDAGSQSIQFNCQGVPVLTLINGSTILSILTYAGADQRAPDIVFFRDHLYPKLMRSGSSLGVDVKQPSGVGAFVLKYRDGIDVSADCSPDLKGTEEM